MTWCSELPILASRGDLRQHVFIQVTFGVPVVHFDQLDHLHHYIQQFWRWDHEGCTFHKLPKHTSSSTYLLHVFEYRQGSFFGWLGKKIIHRLRINIRKMTPTKFLILFCVNSIGYWLTNHSSFLLFQLLTFIQPP